MLDGEIGTQIADRLTKVGIRSLGRFEIGFRNITDSKVPVKSPNDMTDLTIRVMDRVIDVV